MVHAVAAGIATTRGFFHAICELGRLSAFCLLAFLEARECHTQIDCFNHRWRVHVDPATGVHITPAPPGEERPKG